MQFAFCLEMLFREMPFADRLAVARDAGASSIEFWDWRDKDLAALERLLTRHRMRITNLSGNRLNGMIDPAQRKSFLKEVGETAGIAGRMGCARLMLLAQSLKPDGSAVPPPSGLSDTGIFEQIVICGLELANLGDALNLEFVIEPLNTVTDHPGYFLDSSEITFDIIREIHHPRVKVLYDIYHMAMMDEDVLGDIEKHLDLIGYFHVADAPGRNEPGTGKIPYREISALLRKLDFQGLIGFEYLPSQGKSAESIDKALKAFA